MTHTFTQQGIEWLMVAVEKDAVDFKINLTFEFECSSVNILKYSSIKGVTESKFKSENLYEIIGCISKDDKIDFADKIEEDWVEYPEFFTKSIGYFDYLKDEWICSKNKNLEDVEFGFKESFISLLKSEIQKKWKYQENPLGKTPFENHPLPIFFKKESIENFCKKDVEIKKQWKSAQLQVRPDKILLIQIKK